MLVMEHVDMRPLSRCARRPPCWPASCPLGVVPSHRKLVLRGRRSEGPEGRSPRPYPLCVTRFASPRPTRRGSLQVRCRQRAGLQARVGLGHRPAAGALCRRQADATSSKHAAAPRVLRPSRRTCVRLCAFGFAVMPQSSEPGSRTCTWRTRSGERRCGREPAPWVRDAAGRRAGARGVTPQPQDGLTRVDPEGKDISPRASRVNATVCGRHTCIRKPGTISRSRNPIMLWVPLHLTPRKLVCLSGFPWLSARHPSETDGTWGSGWHPHIQPP